MGRKKQKKRAAAAGGMPPGEEVVAANCASGASAEESATKERHCSSQPTTQSSWFPEVKWVSRHDHKSIQTLQDVEVCSSNTGGITEKVDHLLQETEDLKKLPSTSAQLEGMPQKRTHDSLLSELNQIKEQLMPAAKMCADAINNGQCTKKTTPEYEFRQARSSCNPYECLGETYSKNHSNWNKKKSSKRNHSQVGAVSGLSQFINRSAIKLANIDALIGFSLIPATYQKQEPVVHNEEESNFTFVDLCGAPGGFSEYILYRHVHPTNNMQHTQQSLNNIGNDEQHGERHSCMKACYGFGMSLCGSNHDGKGVPWDLDHLKRYHLHSNNTLETRKGSANSSLSYHVCNGADKTGSIYNWENVLQLQRQIVTVVPGKGEPVTIYQPLANLVVADGGFDAQRDSNNQESIAHKIIVSQTAAALSILLPGGSFVLKMFGFREEATRSMLHYLYDSFDRMTFIKPILSRPASAERYLVCQGYNCPGAEWNGFVWREKMMATAIAPSDKKKCTQDYTPLYDLMDSFDLDMLQLNIDTCQSIISYLHAKREAMEQGGSIAADKTQKQYIDIGFYEATWQLL